MIPKIRTRYLLGIFILMFFVVAPNLAQTLDDWKAARTAARNGQGCESIPYSDYRDQCERKSEKVNELCKTDSWSCDGLETRALRGNIQGIGELISRLKDEKDRLNSQRSSSSNDEEKREVDRKIKEIENKIYDRSKELDYMKKSLETDMSDANNRLYRGNQCLEYRKEVQSIFSSATSRAKSESDREIKVIANELLDYWERRAREHQESIDNVKRGMEKCQKCKDGDI